MAGKKPSKRPLNKAHEARLEALWRERGYPLELEPLEPALEGENRAKANEQEDAKGGQDAE